MTRRARMRRAVESRADPRRSHVPTSHFRPLGALRALFYTSLFLGSRVFSRLSNACAYLAAGACTPDDLARGMRLQFDAFGTEPNYALRGFTPFEAGLVERWLPRSGHALVLGCGPGRELVALLRRGYRVTGVEQSHDAAARARTNLASLGLSAPVASERLERVEPDDSYAIVMFSDSCYSNIQGARERITALRRSADRMQADGVLLVFYQHSGSRSRTALGLMRLGAWLARASWQPEPGDSFIPGERGGLRFTHTFHDGEVEAECRAAGFHVVAEETSGRLRCAIARLAAPRFERGPAPRTADATGRSLAYRDA